MSWTDERIERLKELWSKGMTASQIADEVVSHLVGLVGADVEVTIEVAAKRDQGFAGDLTRTVTENAKTLKFEQYGFEDA